MEIKLKSPLKYVLITQPWGVNYLDFYKKMGMLGHNGIDFSANENTFVSATHDGKITWAGKDGDGGISVQILSTNIGEGFYTLYYHLKEVKVDVGDEVKAGDIIGIPNNTGKYTTGNHLHFGLKKTFNGATVNKDNGYGGAIDPTPYFEMAWDKLPVDKFYGRKRNWWAEFWLRFAPIGVKNQWANSGRFIHKELKKRGWFPPMPTGKMVNAIIYGAWDFESTINPLLEPAINYLTKAEFLRGDWFPTQNY